MACGSWTTHLCCLPKVSTIKRRGGWGDGGMGEYLYLVLRSTREAARRSVQLDRGRLSCNPDGGPCGGRYLISSLELTPPVGRNTPWVLRWDVITIEEIEAPFSKQRATCMLELRFCEGEGKGEGARWGGAANFGGRHAGRGGGMRRYLYTRTKATPHPELGWLT